MMWQALLFCCRLARLNSAYTENLLANSRACGVQYQSTDMIYSVGQGADIAMMQQADLRNTRLSGALRALRRSVMT